MGLFGRLKEETFIDENADKLVYNLAYFCAAGAKEVTEVLKDHLPNDLNTDTIFLFLFSMRATIEVGGVRNKFRERAYQRILTAIDSHYRATFSQAAAETGPFSTSLMRDVEASISQSPDPREWIRIHAVRTLQTKDLDDELCHLCLAKVFWTGEPIVNVVERGG